MAGRAGNRRLINMSQAVPSYQPPTDLAGELARLAQLPDSSLYTDIRGLPSLRQALAEHMSEDYRGAVLPEHVTVTAGCNQAFCAALMAIAERGDNVIMPVPYYFNHQMWLQMMGIELRAIPSFSLGRNLPEPTDAEHQINERTRAIVLCSPNNPAGTIYPPALLAAFFDLAQRHGICLIIDETYKDFRENATPPHMLFADSRWPGNLIQLYSFSKVFAITGYRVGSLIAGPHIQAEVEKVMDCIAICAPAISQLVALHGLNAWQSWKDEKLNLMAERRAALLSAFANTQLKYRLDSSGAYFAYVRHPFEGVASRDVAKKLAQEHAVLCLPGSMFGPEQDDHLRLAFANVPAEDMHVLVERLLESQA